MFFVIKLSKFFLDEQVKLTIVPQPQSRKKRDVTNENAQKKLYMEFDSNGKAIVGYTETIINIYHGGFTQNDPNEVTMHVLDKGFISSVGTEVYITSMSHMPVGNTNSSFIMTEDKETGYLSFKSVSEQTKAICYDNVNNKILIGLMADKELSCIFKNNQDGKAYLFIIIFIH